MDLPRRATIVEVGLRDGLQNEPGVLPTAQKLTLAGALLAAGIQEVEAASMVHPRLVPQMADGEAVLSGLAGRPELRVSALVPNVKGTQRVLACPVQEVRYSVITTETYSKINWNMTVAESLAQVRQSVELVRAAGRGLRAVGTVSCAFGCPYEGEVPPEQVLGLVGAFVEMGMDGVILADSAGMGNPRQVQRVTARVRDRWPELELGMHFHNTRGLGLANVLACLQIGIDRFDASVGGLGGCPFSPEAAGNICSVDTAHLMAEMGIETGIDLDRLIAAACLAEQVVGHRLPGLVYRAAPQKRGAHKEECQA